ncbi:MAG: hypothetical protein AAF216_06975 [Pseudomonadota bacterium]
MRKLLIASVFALGLAAPAVADDDEFTLQFIDTDGETVTYWIDEDEYSNSLGQGGNVTIAANGKSFCFSGSCVSLTRSLSRPSEGDSSEYVFGGAHGTVTVTDVDD